MQEVSSRAVGGCEGQQHGWDVWQAGLQLRTWVVKGCDKGLGKGLQAPGVGLASSAADVQVGHELGSASIGEVPDVWLAVDCWADSSREVELQHQLSVAQAVVLEREGR